MRGQNCRGGTTVPGKRDDYFLSHRAPLLGCTRDLSFHARNDRHRQRDTIQSNGCILNFLGAVLGFWRIETLSMTLIASWLQRCDRG